MWPYAVRNVGFKRVSFDSIRKHMIPNVILFIPVIAVNLYKYMDKIMLGYLCNMEQVGFYEYSDRVIMIPITLVNSLSIVMLPKMSNLVATNRADSEKAYISYSMIFSMFFSSSISFGIMGVAKEFVPMFYGSGFTVCIFLYYILLPSCCFIAFSSVLRMQFLIPHKYDSIYIKSVVLGAVVNIVVNLLLISYFQAIGAAIGTLLAEVSVCIYQSLSIKKLVDIKGYLLDSIPFLISGIGMFTILYFIHIPIDSMLIQLVAKILFGAVIFLAFLCVSFALRKEEYCRIYLIMIRVLGFEKGKD